MSGVFLTFNRKKKVLLLNRTWNQGKFCKLGLIFRNVMARESKAANSIRNAKIADYFSISISSGSKTSYSKQTHLFCRCLWSRAIQPLTNAPEDLSEGVKEELIKQGWTVFWKAPLLYWSGRQTPWKVCLSPWRIAFKRSPQRCEIWPSIRGNVTAQTDSRHLKGGHII